MTAWPGSKTLHVTDEGLYTDLNSYVRDALDHLYNAPLFALSRTTAQSIANNTLSLVAWTTELEDAYGFHAASATTVVVPAGLGGLYVLSYDVEVAAGGTTGFWYSRLVVNGAYGIAEAETAGPSTDPAAMAAATLYPLAAGDTVGVEILHANGSALNLLASSDYSPRFAGVYVGP